MKKDTKNFLIWGSIFSVVIFLIIHFTKIIDGGVFTSLCVGFSLSSVIFFIEWKKITKKDIAKNSILPLFFISIIIYALGFFIVATGFFILSLICLLIIGGDL